MGWTNAGVWSAFTAHGIHGTIAPGYTSIKFKRCRVCKRRRGKQEGSHAFLEHILKCEHGAGLHPVPTPDCCDGCKAGQSC